MKLYKLTDEMERTYVNTQWGKDITVSVIGSGKQLCSDSYIHAYTHPLLAVLFNPIHANYTNPILWEAEGEVAESDGLKVGCRTLRTVQKMPLPEIGINARVRFAIYVELESPNHKELVPNFTIWAEGWLSGADRSEASAVWAAAGATVTSWAASAAARATKKASEAPAKVAAALAAVGTRLDFVTLAQRAIADEAEYDRLSKEMT